MANYKVISSDDHVFEPPDLWISKAEDRFKDRVPRIVRGEDGGEWWVCDGVVVAGSGAGAQTGRRFEEPENLSNANLIENVRPGGYIPEERVKDMAIDGVDVSIVYPTVGLVLYRVPDSDFLSSVFATYNDWIAEFCRQFPKQLKGIALLKTDDVHEGIREMERCAKMGLVGAMITVDNS